MIRQALSTAKVVTNDPAVHLEVMRRVCRIAARLSLNQTPARLSQPAYDVIAKVTGIKDPYKRERKETNRIAMRLVPELRTLIETSRDPLDAALHVAVAGNVIDLGIGHKFDIEKDVRHIMKQDFAIEALSAFRKDLKRGRKLLYLGDNAGEIVFDRLLVERILRTGTEVTFVVKSGPIINDAVMKDAREAEMTKLVKVITTGSNDIGVYWPNASQEFRNAVATANIIVSKGHGNFETCHDQTGNWYFLLKAKCDMVAEELGVGLGDIVFKHVR